MWVCVYYVCVSNIYIYIYYDLEVKLISSIERKLKRKTDLWNQQTTLMNNEALNFTEYMYVPLVSEKDKCRLRQLEKAEIMSAEDIWNLHR